jgi:nucleotide-binding universal stress UspA family protein
MTMKILCGTDLSDASDGALDVACALAIQRGDREILLLHIVEPDADLGDGAVLAESHRRLIAAATERTRDGLTVRAELLTGAPDHALVDFAETSGVDLIVIAAQSHHTERDSRLGATAAAVIARTHVPVILVRDPAPWLGFASGASPLKILLGVDDSTTCDLGIQWTVALGKRGPLEVVLGAVYYPDDAAAHYGLPARSIIEANPEIERLIQRDLVRRFAGQTSSPGVAARARRGLGRIGDHMIELATDEHADVIVVGTGQKTGLGRLGSVSSVVVQGAPQSVVCVPPQAAIATHTVPVFRQAVVATDLSPFANLAVPYAFAVVPPSGDIHLLHVVKDDAELGEPARSGMHRQLASLVPANALHKIHTHIVHGDDPAAAIAQCSARLGADIICIASHGRTGITRALVGSVADRVLRLTRLPVLVLRPG